VLREHLREKHDMSSTTELIDDAAFSAAETVLEERHGDGDLLPHLVLHYLIDSLTGQLVYIVTGVVPTFFTNFT